MRLFYDRYSTRPRAELALVAADMLAVVAATLYLAPALLGDAHPLDQVLLVVWAATPRALARILAGLEHPTGFTKVLSAVTIAVVLVAALLGVGWDLIHSASPPGCAPTPLGLGMLLCAWSAGFLVCQPGAYRLFDFFLGGAFLVGLKDGAPQPYIWVPVFFLAICASSAVRHLLHDVFQYRRSPPINLQNARVVAVLGAGAASLAFLAVCLTLGGGRFPEPAARFGDPAERLAAPYASRRDARDRAGGPWTRRGDGAAGAPPREGGRPEAMGGPGDEPGRRIGYTEHVRLSELARPEMDRAIVLRVRGPATMTIAQSRRLERTLWRGVTLSTYDGTTQSWKQPTTLEEAPWPTRLPREVPAGLEKRDAVSLVHFVINPVFENFITPYFTSEISTASANLPVLTYVRSLPGDDVFPQPEFQPYSSYITRTVLADPNDEIPVSPGRGEGSVDPLYVEIPAPADLGVDIRAAARLVFAGEGSVRDRLESLRRYFQAGFEYSVDEDWTGGEAPLRDFLSEHRRGDCTYFATASALLLRAAGLPTRFVAGFAGGEWEPTTGDVVIRNGRAHGWIDVHVEGAGWYPVDATAWLAPAEDRPAGDRVLPGDRPVVETPTDGEEDEARPGDDLLAESSPPPGDEADDPAATDALEGEMPKLASGPRGEGDGGTLPGVVKGLRSFVRREQPGAAGDAAEPGARDSASRTLPGHEGTDDRLETAAADPRRPLLSRNARVAIRAAFLLLSVIVAGMLVYVLVRPPRRKKDTEGEEGEEEEAPLHVPAESTPELAPVFDRASRRDRVLAAYHQLQESLKSTRSHRRPHQTPLEHARWLGRKPTETGESFLRVHRVLYRALYGGQEVSDDDVRSVEQHCQRIRRALG